jgi:hypothetical protein
VTLGLVSDSSGIMKAIKSGIGRTVHEAKVKVGKAEETVDIQFNQESAKFKSHYKHLKKINEDIKKLLTLMKGWRFCRVSFSSRSINLPRCCQSTI